MTLESGTFVSNAPGVQRDLITGGTGYGVIMADPPWSFKNWSDKGKNRNPDGMARQKGLAERHYKTMTLADIKAMPVEAMAADDCALFLWAVDCMLPEAIEVGRGWGFTYKTVAFTWVKEKSKTPGFHIGLGYWTRGNPEQCLLFTRGKPQRRNASTRQLVVAKRREHSRKPDEVRVAIEAMLPGPYVELFARQTAPGWDSWGNEPNRFASPQSAHRDCGDVDADSLTDNSHTARSGMNREAMEDAHG